MAEMVYAKNKIVSQDLKHAILTTIYTSILPQPMVIQCLIYKQHPIIKISN